MTGIVITVLFLIAATRSSKTAPDEAHASSVRSGAQLDGSSVSGAVSSGATDTQISGRVTATVAPEHLQAAVSERGEAGEADNAAHVRTQPRSETCRSARRGLAFYVRRANDWRQKIGAGRATSAPSARRDRACPYTLWRAKLWRSRSFAARQAYGRWLERRTLRDFRVTPDSNAWLRAVQRVQYVFPGTSSWLWNCSAAEGGHGRWVRYGGGSYYPGYEHTDRVGNWLQYRWSTFRGHYRHALDELHARGFHVPPDLRDPGNVRAWLSPLATALAGGWARYTGNDASHWSASWGNGC